MKEILVTAYPKSGITWLIHMLCDLLNSPQQDQPLGPMKYWGPNHGRDYVIRKRHCTYNLSHYEYNITPEQAEKSIIVFLQRDPRDVAVSQWHFRGKKGSFEDNARVMFQEVPITYEQWVRSWEQCDSAIKVKYENLLASQSGVLLDILYAKITNKAPPSLSYCTNVYNRHSFDTMREYLKRPDGYDRITRKGQVGDWHNHFTREFAKEFDSHLGEFMLEYGYISSRDWWKEVVSR